MPNSDLYGKEYNVPSNVLNDLKGSNSQRSQNIVKNGKISYSLLKRLKNIFDTNDDNSEEYGGKTVETWVNEILRNNRSDVHDIKQNQMNTGMFNRFKKTHEKSKDPTPTKPSSVDKKHKDFMGHGIYENKTSEIMKKVIRLTESEFKQILENVFDEYFNNRNLVINFESDNVINYDVNNIRQDLERLERILNSKYNKQGLEFKIIKDKSETMTTYGGRGFGSDRPTGGETIYYSQIGVSGKEINPSNKFFGEIEDISQEEMSGFGLEIYLDYE